MTTGAWLHVAVSRATIITVVESVGLLLTDITNFERALPSHGTPKNKNSQLVLEPAHVHGLLQLQIGQGPVD